jgi:hypothetical protein
MLKHYQADESRFAKESVSVSEWLVTFRLRVGLLFQQPART